MKAALAYFVCFLLLLLIGLPNILAKLSLNLRNECASHLTASEFHELNSALVCGTEVKTPQLKDVFRTTGLIHLLVVSGSHLLFLQNMIALLFSTFIRKPVPFRLSSAALLLFTLLTGLQAPCARAYIQFLLNWCNKKQKLFWRPWHVTLISGLLCLVLFPQWILSSSLMMSWVCALAISMTARSDSPVKQQIMIYFALLPIVASLSAPHPFVILINLVFTPLFGLVVFPLVLLSLVFPPLTLFVDRIWSLIIAILSKISVFTPPLGTFSLSLSCQWVFLLGLHLFVHYRFLRRAQHV
jgi:ComEC/Rec2-related protein